MAGCGGGASFSIAPRPIGVTSAAQQIIINRSDGDVRLRIENIIREIADCGVVVLDMGKLRDEGETMFESLRTCGNHISTNPAEKRKANHSGATQRIGHDAANLCC